MADTVTCDRVDLQHVNSTCTAGCETVHCTLLPGRTPTMFAPLQNAPDGSGGIGIHRLEDLIEVNDLAFVAEMLADPTNELDQVNGARAGMCMCVYVRMHVCARAGM